MSAISNFLTFLRSAIYAIDVRDGIADAIEQCYNDVNNPTLKTEALEAALQTKIDEGEMAALTIGDGTITAAKLASGVIDNTLATSGAAADAKKTGDEIAAVKADLDAMVTGLTDRQKQALLSAFDHVAWDGDDPTGQMYISALHASLYGTDVDSITVSFSQDNNPVFDSDSLDVLRPLLAVVAHYSNGTSGVVTDYELSGSLNSTTSTITVTYEGKTATFNVSVTMPTFDYKAARDGLLSAKSGITTDTNSASSFSESVTSLGNLRLKGTKENASSSNIWFQFKIGDNPTTGKWRMRTRVMLYRLTGGTFQSRLSNGTSGIRISTTDVDGSATVFLEEGESRHSVATGLTIGAAEQWYDIELFIDSSEPVQRLTIDGESIYESSIFETSVANNSIFIFNECLIFIDTIKLYNV